ncbi:MAG TPA: HPF/RaiA family ribosome-associated protein [Burkholderiales bacterium]|nr:HPF/RaiA family ribosome-associated protein [Burkholderiales bacterium]
MSELRTVQTPLQIVFHGISHSDALETHIREKAQKLDSFHPQVLRCHVTVEQPHKHKHQGNRFNVRIDLNVPGDTIAVNRDAHEDVYVALRDAFDAACRQLEDSSRRTRGAVKHHREPQRSGSETDSK